MYLEVQEDTRFMEQLEADEDEDREETVDEKIDRLGKEVEDLQEEVSRIRSSSPPITRPPVPEPLLKLRCAIKEKDTERELLLEDQRASKVVEEYLQENPSILEKVDDCPICLEPIFDFSGVFACCGKNVCPSCSEPLRRTANDTCPLCRGRFPPRGEGLRILHSKAAAGHAWAQCILGIKYFSGSSELAVDEQKAESLFRSAADQGDSVAYDRLGQIEDERNNVSEARQLFEAAASRGHMSALGHLGATYYCIGESSEKDAVKAVRLVTVSAKLQSTALCAHEVLGYCFARGEGGLEPSTVRSVYYMKAAVEDTELSPNFMILYASSLLDLAALYFPDYNIPPSGHNVLPEALFWFRRADAISMNAAALPFLGSVESAVKELCACCYRTLSTDKPKCCVECRAAHYCCRECQVKDWKAGHKKDCVKSLKKRLRATGKFDNI